MAVLELDYMEYANDEAAQTNYISSSEPASWGLLNEPCNDFTTVITWTDQDGADGISEIDPAGQFHFYITDPPEGSGKADRTGDFGSCPATYTVEMKIYFDALGTKAAQNWGYLICFDGTTRLLAMFASDGLYILGSGGWVEVGTDIVQTGVWQTYRFLVTAATDVDVYLDTVLQGADIACDAASADPDGKIQVGMYGDSVATESHIDYIKIASGLYVPGILNCYSEDTIVQQGSYSLEAIAKQTGSLNETLTKSGLSLDLTDKDTLKLWIYALRTGTNIQIQIHDSGGTTSTKDIVISSATTWTEITWDISGISNANKDDIDSIIIKIINADADNTFYIDNFYAIIETLELYDIDNDFRNAILVLKDTDNKFNSAIEIKKDIIDDFRFLSQVIKDFNNKFNSALEVVKDIINDFRSVFPTVEGIFDYMEYATDEDAQNNYVSSDVFSWDKLDEDCAGIDDWSDADAVNGESTQVTFDSKSCFKFDTKTAAGGNASARTRALTLPDNYTVEIKLYCDQVGTVANSDYMLFDVYNGETYFSCRIASDGLFIYDGATYNEVGTDLIQQDTWQVWRFEVKGGASATAKCDVYLNNILQASDVDCSATGIEESVKIFLLGETTNDNICYFDYIKIGTGLYSTPALQCYSEDTIIQQGDYSLKIEALQTYSLNETLTKSGLAFDLTNRNEIKLYVRSDRTGTNLQARIHDTGGTWSTKDINITQANVFQEIAWDISGIATANKDYIDKIEFKIINADSDTIYYIDYFTSEDQLYDAINDFRSAISELKDVINDFRMDTKIEVLTDVTNDFRLIKEELKNIDNDFRMVIGGLFGINNDFRSAIEVLADITNKFSTLYGAVENLNNKSNIALRVLSNVNVNFAFATGALIDFNNDVRTHKLIFTNITNNFRMIRTYQVPEVPEVGLQALGKSYFTVKINGVDKSSILDLDSLSWKETLNSSSTASFILGVPYDSGSCPTENQTVEILFNNHRKFYGYITNITKVSNPEGIQILAEDEYWNLNKTEVDFKVGRKLTGDPDTYYATIQSALIALGFSVGIGNFTPVNMSLVGSKGDVISRLVQESGNFQWFVKPDGNKKLWQADKGDVINLEKQAIGTNLGLYQVINHNIVKDSSGIVNKFKVIMGEDIVPGYNNEFRFAYISQNYEQYSPEYIEHFYDGEPFSESQRKHVSSIQWYDKRRTVDTDAYEAYVEIAEIGGEKFRITVPSGMLVGYPLKYKAVYDIGVSWERDVLSENTLVWYSNPYWYDWGGIYPEARRERTFEVTMGTYPHTIVKDLVLSNLNVQYGTNYKVWEGHNWSYSDERTRTGFPALPEPAKYTVNRTGAYLTEKSFKIFSWNDVAYATDYANWQLSKNCEIKEKGSVIITMDCADFYGLDLSKRINISGITSEALNIVAISYDVRNYRVTVTLESSRTYTRTVSVPVHIREE